MGHTPTRSTLSAAAACALLLLTSCGDANGGPSASSPLTASPAATGPGRSQPPSAAPSSSAPPGPSAPDAAPDCRVADLDGTAEAFADQASSRSALVQLRNVSDAPCLLGGAGDLRLLDDRAQPLPTSVLPTGRPAPVVLDPGFAIGTLLEWRVVPDAADADPAKDCRTAGFLDVQPEGLGEPLTVEVVITACNAGELVFPGWTLQVG